MVQSATLLQGYYLQDAISPGSARASAVSRSSDRDGGSAAFVGDQVSISDEARALLTAEAIAAEPEVSPDQIAEWLERLDLQEGTFTLKNGRTREISLDGNKFEIKEYENGKLASSISGKITGSGVAMDSEIYDKNGRVAQAGHIELTSSEDGSAKVTRSFQWFENKQLVREMHDSMELASESIAILDESMQLGGEAPELEELLNKTTKDTNISAYSASIQEYANGVLVRDAQVSRNATSVNMTNRSGSRDELNGLDPWSTEEIWGQSGLSIRITEFDADGGKLREASFDESHTDDHESGTKGGLSQNFSVAWYVDGELLKKSQGSLTMEESETTGIQGRADILEILNMSEEEYASRDAQSATELLSQGAPENATDAGFFTDSLRHHLAQDKYDTAENVSKGRAGDRPYSVSWVNEIYRDGQLAARQEDRESSRKSYDDDPISFRTGGGLREDDYRAVLRSTSHVDESYENGRIKKRASLESREFIEENQHGPDKLKTFTKGKQGMGLNSEPLTQTLTGGIDTVDAEAHKASGSMSDELGLTFEDAYNLFKRLDPENAGLLGARKTT